MLLSIIVPVYNGDKYIKRCIESIISQMNELVEVIIIDDGSSDHTVEKCNELIANNPSCNLSIFSIQNGGLANARNVGIDNAKGEYIINLDVDDYLLPGIVSAVIDKLSMKPDVLFWGFQDFDEDSKKVYRHYQDSFCYINGVATGYDAFEQKASGTIAICQGNACYKRDNILLNNLYNIPGLNQGEDYLFIMKNLSFANTVVSIDTEGVAISTHRDSMCHSNFNESHLQIFDAWEKLYDTVKYLKDSNSLIEAITVNYEIFRIALAHKIVDSESLYNKSNSIKVAVDCIKEYLPQYKPFRRSKLSRLKLIESVFLNNMLLVYVILIKCYRYIQNIQKL